MNSTLKSIYKKLVLGSSSLFIVAALFFVLPSSVSLAESQVYIIDINHSVVKMSLEKGVSIDDARTAILSKADELNMKKVGHKEVSKNVIARGIKNVKHLELFQFCNPEDAVKMAEYNPIFAAYMPCTIAMVEDEYGVVWLTMLNLDMLINSTQLPQHLLDIALRVNGNLLKMMTAGVTGEF